MFSLLLQYDDGTASGAAGAGIVFIMFLAYLAFLVVALVSAWKLFIKMGDPGWMGIVPLLNIYRIFQRSRPEQAILWTVLSFVCLIGSIVAAIDIAKLFGKSIGYAIGIIFLPIVFLPMLAFGDAQYQGPPPPALS